MPEETGTQTETQTEPTSPVNADGTFTEDWHGKYGEDNKAHLSRYKTFDALVDSHISQRKKFSKDPSTLIEIPTEHSSDEVKVAFHKARGVPDESDSYEYTLSDELSVKLGPIDDKRMAAFKKFAHEKLHLNQQEFKDALDFYHADIASSINAFDISFNEKQEQSREAGVAVLKTYFGNSVEDRTLRSEATMRKYGDMILKDITGKEFNPLEELHKEIPAIKNSPWARIIFDNVAEHMDEDTLKGLGPLSGPTRDNVKTQIAEIRSQMDTIIKENPSNYKGNVKFKDLQTRKTELYKLSKQMSA